MRQFTDMEANKSREEIQKAMSHFLSKGGKIKVLPPQKENSRILIEDDKWNAYESMEELFIV